MAGLTPDYKFCPGGVRMQTIVAPESIAEELKQTAKEFLSNMESGEYDAVWHRMITSEAARLLSTALFPIDIYKKGKIDELLDSHIDGGFAVTFDEVIAYGFQTDMKQIRSGFFTGLASAMKPIGWYEATFGEDSMAFVDSASAILIDPTTEVPAIFLFVEQPEGTYGIDLEALALFSTVVTASSLYHIGMRALELGKRKSAISYFELAAGFAQPYSRIERLMLTHFMIQHMFTGERKQELREEGKYVLLARHQMLLLLSSPKLSSESINMGRFLTQTFKGYSNISEMELEPDDINLLNQLDDTCLRQALASILNGVNPVAAQREANKPHGSHEISDMEIIVQHEDEMHRLSIPVKSGREINEDKVPVSIAYQIIRPFLYFPDGIVVFVTAKPCSQYLHNYIKAANDTLGLSIEVIEHNELAKLLKDNSLLTSVSPFGR